MNRPTPYPSETQAKGWRFELDYEQIDQSDTWDLAAEIPMAQPALLMMWLVAWRQKPCGSLPADEAVIRSKCRIPPAVWTRCREVCMRGWWVAEDGRLYHDTIVKRVLAMLDKRASDAQRAANRRARKADSSATHDGITDESRVTRDGPTREFDTKHQAPSTKDNSPKPPRGGKAAVSLKTWAEVTRAKGEKLIPDDDPVFGYAKEVGIPDEFMGLAWSEFKHRYGQPEAKRYKDWRAVFRKAVRGNWLKLWFLDGDTYRLTTVGHQATRTKEAA